MNEKTNTAADIEKMISRIALGDRAAFNSLYSATSAKLFGVCLRVLGDRAETEDAIQDVYIKIWHSAGRYSANGYSPMTWLITVARNTAIDRLRARKRGADQMDEDFDMRDETPGPEAAAIAKSEAARIKGCLDELDDEKSQAVQLAYLDGYTYADLADRFSIPLNTMRTWLRRSLLKLKDCLNG